jgi:hypothetical protein
LGKSLSNAPAETMPSAAHRNRFAVEPDLHWAISRCVANRSWLGSTNSRAH